MKGWDSGSTLAPGNYSGFQGHMSSTGTFLLYLFPCEYLGLFLSQRLVYTQALPGRSNVHQYKTIKRKVHRAQERLALGLQHQEKPRTAEG